MRISNRVNQNSLFAAARLLCAEYGISLAKNPSYLPEQRTVVLKTAKPLSEETEAELRAAFEEKTGCDCAFSE